VRVAGRSFSQTFPPIANRKYTFEWDGKDSYGRSPLGGQQVTVQITYFFDAKYDMPPGQGPAARGALEPPRR
jgi:hypothetical protein